MNLEQRKYIKRLLDELDRADNYIKSVYLENEQLKDNWNKLKEIMEEETREYWNTNILEIMQKIEGSDSNGNN